MKSAPARNMMKTALLAMAWCCLVLAGTAAAQVDDEPLEITDIRLSNYGGNNFVISWRTSQATTDNELLFGLSSGAMNTVRADVLPEPSRLHYVQITNADLLIDSVYYYKVRSGGIEGSVNPAGYDSVLTRQQVFSQPGATVQGYVVDARTNDPLPNIIVRSFLRTRRPGTGGVVVVDSTQWYAVLTGVDGKYNWSLSNYRTYSGGNIAYVSGNTWLHLEIFGQGDRAITDSVLLTLPRNEVGQSQTLNTYELENRIETARNGYLRATGPVLSNGISASVVSVTVLDAENKPVPNVQIRLEATPDRGVEYLQPLTPTDRFGKTWGLVYSDVAEIKTIRAINISSADSLYHVPLDSFAQAEFIPELNADVARDTVAPFIYFTTEYRNTQNTTGPYVITSRAVDNFRMRMDLLSTTQVDVFTDTAAMENVVNTDDYNGNIMGQPFNTTVRYLVIASDSAGHRASMPDSIHSSQFVAPYSFEVLQDTTGVIPTMGIILTTDRLSSTTTVRDSRISTWVLSNRALSAVTLQYRNVSVGPVYSSIPMDHFGAYYWADIPAAPAGSRIEYFVQVTDKNGKPERDRRDAPYSREPFSYEILSPGSLGTIELADTTSVLGGTATLPSRASALADINEDGMLDVVVANYGAMNKVYYYKKTGGLEDVTSSVLGTQGQDKTTHVAIVDVNADDYLDVIFANDMAQNRLYINNSRGGLKEFTFTLVEGSSTKAYMPTEEWGTQCIVPGDFDGDGDIDLYLANSIPGGEQNRMLFNNGVGVFSDSSAVKLFNEPVRQSVWAIRADIDNDNDPDIVVINRADQHYALINTGKGVMQWRALSSNSSANARGGDMADVDGDGDLDLVVAQSDFTQNELYLNDGRGNFTRDLAGRLPAESSETYGITFLDANADGSLDLLYSNYGQTNALLLNDGSGHFFASPANMIPPRSANSRSAVAGDFNNDNRVDVYISEDQWANTVLFSRSFDPSSVDLPMPFDLLAPADNDTVNTTTVSFAWNASVSADSTDVLTYDFLLALDNQFSNNSLVATREGLSDTTLALALTSDNTRYFWKVLVKGQAGYPIGSLQTNSVVLMTTHQGQGPEFYVLINRNPVFAGHVTAYIVASEPLLTNPTVSFNNQQVAAVGISNTIYRAHFVSRSSFLLTVSGRNISGNEGTFSKTYSSSLASATLASAAMTPDRLAWLEPGSSGGEVRLLASTNEPVESGALRDAINDLASSVGTNMTGLADTRSFSFTVMEGALASGARIVIDGNGVDEPGRMTICRLDQRGWQPLPTNYDQATGRFSAKVDKDGTFALLAIGPGSSQLPRATSFNLAQNSPNPFNPSTLITFTVPGDQPVNSFSLKIYNLRGQVIKTLVDGTVEPGSHTIHWDGRTDSGRDASSGVYFYRMNAPGATMTRKMVLLR